MLHSDPKGDLIWGWSQHENWLASFLKPCKNSGSVKPIKWVVVCTKIRYPQIHGFIIHISFKVYWCSFPGTSIPHSGRIQLSYCWLAMLCIPFYPHENHSWPSRCHSDQDHVCHWVAEVDRWLDFKDVVDLYTVINHRWYEMGFNGVLWWLNGI